MSTVAQADTHAASSPKRSRFAESAIDVFAGAVGGIAQVLVGQPFDLVKVRLQRSGHGNVLGLTRDIFVKEGPLAFYKGTLLPLLGIGGCVSIQFGAFHEARKSFERWNASRYGQDNTGLSLGQYYLSGAAAGVANSVLSTPIEHVRIRLQTQPHGASRIFQGPQDCVRQLMANAGIASLYRGNVPCLIREFHGFGLWFLTYEALMNYKMRKDRINRSEISLWHVAFYGGLAGEALWLGTFPIDVVKTKMQSDGYLNGTGYKTMRAATLDTWQRQGVKGFWSGLVPTLVRTMLTSAATFVVAEQVKQALS